MAQRETCPNCGKKGIGAWQTHRNPHTGYTYAYKECRYCSEVYLVDQWEAIVAKRHEEIKKRIREKNMPVYDQKRIVRVRK